MFPNNEAAPILPYQFLTTAHYLFDLIYNPAETEFLHHGSLHGAHILNGIDMLHYQAERNWEIWNSN
jgi:shikimate dehydrogenase